MTTDTRPWGYFEVLTAGPGFQVKRIVVNAHSATSLQFHEHRAEHWVVVSGIATAMLHDVTHTLTSGESLDVPISARHRLGNDIDEPLVVIEVQLGDYLGEDDITRLEDRYGRD
jgi:mannose-6-phosphate isomerase-like protein (cupin superfamily)